MVAVEDNRKANACRLRERGETVWRELPERVEREGVSEMGPGADRCGSAVQTPRKSSTTEAEAVRERFEAETGKEREGRVPAWSGMRRAREKNGF